MKDICLSGIPLDIVLVEPEIPGNTGSTARTCAAIGAALHLVHPIGFRTDDAAVRRAGLDYWHLVEIHHHDSFEACVASLSDRQLFLASTKGGNRYDTADLTVPAALVFGKETKGLADSILAHYPDRIFRIPIREDARSLNLSNAVSVFAFECMRQRNFAGLEETRGDVTFS